MPKLTPIAFSVACALTITGCAGFSRTSPATSRGPLVQPVFSVQHSESGAITGAIYRVGRFFEDQGRYPQAIPLYREVIKREPKHVEARSSLGVSLVESGRYEEAIAEFEAAIAISPSSAYLHNNLGYALLLKGSNEQAIKALEVAHRLDPSPEQVASYNLRLAHQRIAAAENERMAVAPRGPHAEGQQLSLADSLQPRTHSVAPATQITDTPRAGLELIKVAPSVYELRSTAKSQAGQAVTRTEHTGPARQVAPLLKPFKLEVSNGNGITGLAKRVAGRLAELGVIDARLTNQRPFEQGETEIQYRDGYAAEAAAFADKLQRKVGVVPSKRLASHIHVRLVLGKDLPSESALVVPLRLDRTLAARLPK
jgi:Tfp pilus assembly protein PilF